MKTIPKLICASSIALGLSACGSVTKDVLQSVYDNKAESGCRSEFKSSSSTSPSSNPACLNGRYYSTLDPNSKDWDLDKILKKKEEDENPED